MKQRKIDKIRIMGFSIAIGLAIVISLSAINVVQAQESGQYSTGEKVGQVDVKNLPEITEPIPPVDRQIPILFQDPIKFAKDKKDTRSPGFIPPGQAKKKIVPANITVTNLGLILEGAPGGGWGSGNPCSCSPPDVNLGVGPKHVFQMVNLAGIIYSKAGALFKPTFSLGTFFGLPASSMSDPVVLFDAMSGRWFASIIDIPNGKVKFAVSTTDDPMGTWNLYNVNTSSSNVLPDQPFIGVSDDKLVISANDFLWTGAGYAYQGVQYWVVNKAQVVSGAATFDQWTIPPAGALFSVHPAQQYGSSGGTSYMITVNDAADTTTLFKVNGVPPGAVSVTTTTGPINPISVPPDATQPGPNLLNTNDDRVISSVWESGHLWFSLNDACIPTGDGTTRSCSRLVEITTGATPTKLQDFDYALSGQYFFYPAVSLSTGQLVNVYGRSSSSIYPSALATGRAPTDPVNTLQASATIKTGTAIDTSGRYGDYFGAATDPTPTSGFPFWVTAEYRMDSAFSKWNTTIAQIGSFGPPPTILPEMVFAKGSDSALWYRTNDGVNWGPWTSLGGILSSDPEAGTWFNKVIVFVKGTDSALWYRTYDGTAWSPWTSLGGIVASGAGAS